MRENGFGRGHSSKAQASPRLQSRASCNPVMRVRNSPCPIPQARKQQNSKRRLAPATCHHHIYDAAKFSSRRARLALFSRMRAVVEYKMLQRRTGTSRDIVVTPRPMSPTTA